MELSHGGDVIGYRIRSGRAPLDFSASLNPLGMPAAVREAAIRAVDDSFAYPDPLCRRLASALARHLGVPEEYLFCGNGAADVIYRLTMAAQPRRALLTAPAFSEYEQGLRLVDCAVEHHFLNADDGFVLDDDILAKIVPGLDILFLCQPNNPTGKLIAPALLLAILERCAATGTLLVVDECFCHFVADREKYSLLAQVGRFANLFILDSFTKLYGMAGIRLGYGVSSDTALLEKVAMAGQPWAVSTVAQAAGMAVLNETAFVEESRRVIFSAKQTLVAGLQRAGMKVIGDAANYVFFHSPLPELGNALKRKGVMIRDCGNFRGLGSGYYRVAVRLEAENAVLLQAIAELVNG